MTSEGRTRPDGPERRAAETPRATSRRSVLKAGAVVLGAGVVSTFGYQAMAAPSGGNRSRSKGRRVAVFGAGPGGMSAAHELAERGFTVDVYERFDRLGGGVRSFVTPGAGSGGRSSLPNTSGGHFFLPGYAAVPDMLMRIPTGDGRRVIDRLVLSSHGRYGAQFGLNGAMIALGMPTSPEEIRDLSPARIQQALQGSLRLLGETWPTDAPLLASKVAAWVTSGPLRRARQLEYIDLEYGFFRSNLLSPGAHTFIADMCNTVSVDSPTHGINSQVYLTAVADQMMNMTAGRKNYPTSPDKAANLLLDGPETEVWFDPWARYLAGLGAEFHTGRTLTEIGVDSGRIIGATVRDAAGRHEKVEADWYVLAMPPDRLLPLLNQDVLAADPDLATVRNLDQSVESGFELFFREPLGFELGQITNRGVTDRWLLTLVGLSEVWDLDLRNFGDGNVRGMLSVEFNNHPFYDSPGAIYRKPLKDLDYDQAFQELRTQIVEGVPAGKDMFAKGNFLGWRPHPTLTWNAGSGWQVPDHRTASAPGTTRYFPEQVRGIPNLFLVGGHTNTVHGGDCMDSAALSAKIATNAIIDAAGVNEPTVDLPFYDPPPELKAFYDEDDRRFRAGLPNVFDSIAPARMPGN